MRSAKKLGKPLNKEPAKQKYSANAQSKCKAHSIANNEQEPIVTNEDRGQRNYSKRTLSLAQAM